MKKAFVVISIILIILIIITTIVFSKEKGETYNNPSSYLTAKDISSYPTNPPLPKPCTDKGEYPCLRNHFVWTSPTTIDYKWSTSSLQSALWWNGDKGIRYPYMEYATEENKP
jgi:hypothetical protein